MCKDITTIPEFVDASLILSIFTIQFTDRSKRQEILNKIYSALSIGGAFIWAEKVHADSSYWEQTFTSAHYDYKRKSFTAQEILDKEQDLRNMMRLQTSSENQDMAWKAGFTNSALLWKFFNFECYVYLKEKI
jgi:tRNA (cmo5U34)-methyltransferase